MSDWIPCAERLPEHGPCIITTADGRSQPAFCEDGQFWPDKLPRFQIFWKKVPLDQVLAWMELPPPYRPDAMKGAE